MVLGKDVGHEKKELIKLNQVEWKVEWILPGHRWLCYYSIHAVTADMLKVEIPPSALSAKSFPDSVVLKCI